MPEIPFLKIFPIGLPRLEWAIQKVKSFGFEIVGIVELEELPIGTLVGIVAKMKGKINVDTA